MQRIYSVSAIKEYVKDVQALLTQHPMTASYAAQYVQIGNTPGIAISSPGKPLLFVDSALCDWVSKHEMFMAFDTDYLTENLRVIIHPFYVDLDP